MVIIALVCVFGGMSAPVSAQHQELNGLDVTDSGSAYTRATRFRGINAQVVYFDPSQPPPPLSTNQAVRPENPDGTAGQRRSVEISGDDMILYVIVALVLFGTVYIAIRFGGGLQVSFAPKNRGKSGKAAAQRSTPADSAPMPVGLDAILVMPDRTHALIALCKSLLARVVAGEGVLVQKSWTDRDTLRRVPMSHAQRDALTALVMDSERAQFGGREITEDVFQGHVAGVKPLLRGDIS